MALDILGYGGPIQGETLCASLGRTNAIPCGTVTSMFVRYLSDTPSPDILPELALPGDPNAGASGGPW